MAGLYNSNNSNNNKNATNQATAPFAPAPMVDELARQNVAMQQTQGNANAVGATQSGGTNMNVFANGNGVVGKYNVNTAVTQQPTVPYDANTGENTRQPVTDFTRFGTAPVGGWSEQGTPIYPSSSKDYDLRDENDRNYKYDSLSAALNGTNATQSQANSFKKDETKKDGGFFDWIKGLMPKSRPGRHLGESDDEYDARRTKNMQMVATLADAIRHIGNIVNTSKGAPVQTFNDPSALLEAGYQTRKAARQKQAALDADAKQKQAEMSLKERANAVDEAYKKWTMGLKAQEQERNAKNDAFNREFKAAGLKRQLDNDEFAHTLATNKFEESKRHNKVSESQGAQRISLTAESNAIRRAGLAYKMANGGGSSGGKGGKGKVDNIPTNSGYLTRRESLSTIEKKSLWQYMVKHGYITTQDGTDAKGNPKISVMTRYNSALNSQERADIISNCIAYAASMGGAKGDEFRNLLMKNYRYTSGGGASSSSSVGGATGAGGSSGGNKGGKGSGGGKKTPKMKNVAALGL
jgi:uncharacterized membrane protein YgcG